MTGYLMIYLGRMYKTNAVTYFKAQLQDFDGDSRKGTTNLNNDSLSLRWIFEAGVSITAVLFRLPSSGICIVTPSYACHISRSSHLTGLRYTNNVRWGIKSIQLPPASCRFVSCGSKYSLQHFVINRPQSMSSLSVRDQVHTKLIRLWS
jgi:hypothetical protein